MQIIKTTILFGLLLAIVLPMHAQEDASNYTLSNGVSNVVLALNRLEAKKGKQLESAQSIWDGKGYAMAADMFKANTSVDEADKELWSKLATAARLNANYEEATYWYQKVTQDDPLPQDLLYYAQALQATDNCTEAIKWFNLYNASPVENKVAYIKNCDDVNQFLNFDKVSMDSLENLNTNKLDFSARPFKEGVVFTSNRGSNMFSRLVDNWTNNSYTDLYFSKKGEDGYMKPVVLKSAVNGKFHDGAATFIKDYTVMYFTRNDNDKKSKNSTLNLKIYEATNSEGINWSKALELPFNGEEFSTCHPTVSKDGKTMYFASDRPGGYGGMDIYKTTYAFDEWTTPQNVGPSINSAGNEIFPFLTAEGDLAFSSNGHPGMGGLDVYVARQSDATSNNWDRIVNAGKPFNSIKDDFGFYINEDNTEGFVSSGRVGEKGNDDIYEWNTDDKVEFFPELSKEQMFCLVDEKSGEPIINAAINVKQSENDDKSVVDLNTDDNGQFGLTVWPTTQLQFAMSKEGFVDGMEKMNFETIEDSESACITVELKKIDAISVVGRVINKDENDSPIAGATITLISKCTNVEKTFTSNSKGEFDFDVPCDCDYSVVGEKTSFAKSNQMISKEKVTCNDKKEIVLALSKPVPAKVEVPLFNGTVLAVGSIIAIDNINYDFNKSTIRSDAAIELDRLVVLMNQFPKLKIELGSHTDARGTSTYNQKLSTTRAQSAVNYLTSKGIASNRTTSRGYGESNLLNTCKDSSDCSEEEHEVNRRTEIKVINF